MPVNHNLRGMTFSALGTFCLIIVLMTVFSIVDSCYCPAYSQQLFAKVTIILEKLPELKQEELKNFYRTIEEYINSTEWVENDQGGEIPISMQFLLSDISSSAESRYRANMIVSNDKDLQYFDRRCLFAYQTGEPLTHNENNPTSLTALIDFYLYLIIGGEFDKYSKLGGTPYFEKAKRCAAHGKFGLGRFIEGWDLREKLILNIFSDKYEKFREMKDDFFLGVYLFDEENERAKGRHSVYNALLKIEKIFVDDPKNEDCKLFLGAYSNKIIEIFKDAKNKDIFNKLIKLDPERKSLYEQHLK